MRVIPALDLREGACVQLVGGRYEDERVRLGDPLAVARGWREAGFRELHVVDLDAATGRGDNAAVIEVLLREPGLEVQAGGGVRDEAAVERLLGAGAARVVVGTRALEDHAWLERTSAAHPGRLIVAADVRGRAVVTHGWSRDGGTPIEALLARLGALSRDGGGSLPHRGGGSLPLAGVLVTAVHREGAMAGTDLELMRDLAGLTELPVFASGGITTFDELAALADLGIAAAILGMALYTGVLDPERLVREYTA